MIEETRIYIVHPYEMPDLYYGLNPMLMTDDLFMLIAEETGKVWSSEGFEEMFNGEGIYEHSDSYIRIRNVSTPNQKWLTTFGELVILITKELHDKESAIFENRTKLQFFETIAQWAKEFDGKSTLQDFLEQKSKEYHGNTL